MKLRIYTLDLEMSAKAKRGAWIALACSALLGGGAVLAAPSVHKWNNNDVLTAADLNDSFAAMQGQVDAVRTRKLTRAHGNGPNESLTNAALPSRKLVINKGRDDTGLRIVWTDNTRCMGTGGASCAWEIKVDGSSCAMPGPMNLHKYTGGDNNLLFPGSFIATCFGVAAGPHVLQVYVSAPVPASTTGGATPAGTAWTGWNEAYWLLEAEEVL